MIVSCNNNNDEFNPSLIILINPNDIINNFYEEHVSVKEESISISDLFKKLNLPLKIKYIFHHNPCVFINFSGTIRDLLTYLHNVTDVHSNISIENNNVIITFSECKTSKYYHLEGVNPDINNIISAIAPYTTNVSKITNQIICVNTSCKNHEKIVQIINMHNYLNNIYIEIEFTTIDIHVTSEFDNNCIDFIKSSINIANNNKKISFNKIIDDISDWMNSNSKGHAEITSNTFCTLFNNSSVEIHTGIDDTSKQVSNRKQHVTSYDKNKSYIKLNISAQCNNTEYANLKFIIQNKCELGDKRAGINNTTIHAKIKNGTIHYLIDQDGGRSISKKSIFTSSESHKIRQVVLVKINIKEGGNHE